MTQTVRDFYIELLRQHIAAGQTITLTVSQQDDLVRLLENTPTDGVCFATARAVHFDLYGEDDVGCSTISIDDNNEGSDCD